MTPQARIRRIGWFAMLAICAALYAGLHLKVQSVKSDVVRAERRIVQLEDQNLLLETEFLTRSSQLQLAQWNRVDFGYTAPEASQFISGQRQLASLGRSRVPGDRPDVRLASYSPDEVEDDGIQLAMADEPVVIPAAKAVSEPERRGIIPASLRVEKAPEHVTPVLTRASASAADDFAARIQLNALADTAIP